LQPKRLPILSLVMVTALWLVPGTSHAQSRYDYTVGLMAGIGGFTDADPDTELDNLGLQALFSLKTQPQTKFSVRAGQLDFDLQDAPFLPDATLRYVTASGEYLFTSTFYESGLFIGLGLYDVQDAVSLTDAGFLVDDDSGFGVTVGTSGDFRINERLSVIVEFAGHYADLDHAQIFLTGHVGIAYHF